MTYYEHIPFREDIPAYALGALDAEDIAALEAHLRTCASCREELAAYREASDNLLLTLPSQKPPTALRNRLQKQLPSAQRAVGARVRWSFGRVAAGIALIVLLALNVLYLSQVRALQRQQTQLMNQLENGQMALVMLSYPHTQSFPINEASLTGSLLLDTEYNNAVLILRGLPSIPDSQTYQVWLIAPNGERVSAALLRPRTDVPFIAEPIDSTQDLANFVGVGMTIEPAGGSDQPTGLPIFRVDF